MRTASCISELSSGMEIESDSTSTPLPKEARIDQGELPSSFDPCLMNPQRIGAHCNASVGRHASTSMNISDRVTPVAFTTTSIRPNSAQLPRQHINSYACVSAMHARPPSQDSPISRMLAKSQLEQASRKGNLPDSKHTCSGSCAWGGHLAKLRELMSLATIVPPPTTSPDRVGSGIWLRAFRAFPGCQLPLELGAMACLETGTAHGCTKRRCQRGVGQERIPESWSEDRPAGKFDNGTEDAEDKTGEGNKKQE
ncbi:hypothetical protein MKZ38_009489 [Zalerion maritima]|uniref:Uncharacterized protein n=1 Tax=Zalerion maritima TaxID=339359 RepID=A0AAD5WN56_9PEZI|nr:hypothetical protein MKZ38_009489 [Zalerion maritima]